MAAAQYETNGTSYFYGPEYADPSANETVIIAGTLNHSWVVDDLVANGKLDVSDIAGQWESFVTQVVADPLPGCARALVIAGSDPRGAIFGLYDVSEQIGVSPWYWWADVAVPTRRDIYALVGAGGGAGAQNKTEKNENKNNKKKTQGPPSVRYRGFFLNDEQPALSGWVARNYADTPYGVGYGRDFYPRVFELLLRLRANYLWPAVWASMFEVDDPANQPLADAWEIVLGSSHTEPMMRAQNEFATFYTDEGLGSWAYNLNNETIDEYFVYGAQRAKPYARNSLWTMSMRGTGDTAIEDIGAGAIVTELETVVSHQRTIIGDVLGVDVAEVPQMWCLYKEVMSYIQEGLVVPDDITLLWADDNWGNVRRVPINNETSRAGGAGVYFHFDYVGDPRDYKWINTIQLQKTAEQMQLSYAHGADRIWVVNVGDLKPLEIPINHFLDMAYDAEQWGVGSTSAWTSAWATREFGSGQAAAITSILNRYGMFAARRKYELVEPETYSTLNYNEGDAVLQQWQDLADDAQAVYDTLDEAEKPSFFEMVLHPVLAGQIVHQLYIGAEKNAVYANQHRNAANSMVSEVLTSFNADANLTLTWNKLLDGKWNEMMSQTHLGYNGYWQQPMRNVAPAMSYVQSAISAIAGNVGIAIEASNASIPGDDPYHDNSGLTLELPPMDPYGPSTRWIDIYSRGTLDCDWSADTDTPWVKLSQHKGTVGPVNGTDSRIYVSVDWASAPQIANTTANINFTAGCGSEGFSEWYGAPQVQVPIAVRQVPSSFTEGFVESDGHVAIEGPHYQRIYHPSNESSEGSNVSYYTLDDYGRTMGGVTLWPQTTPPLAVDEAPALEYDLYLFTANATAAVTLHLSPTQNYLSDVVRFVGDSVGADMPAGWDAAVADAVWGVDAGHNTTTSWDVTGAGAYTLRVWGLAPSVVVQRVVVDLGGVRPSYLGPPESFLVGRDEYGRNSRTSFAGTPGVLGRVS
ncbi:hypothetical protein GGR56DRAFT_556660 [Xylariaceae sp. FL0804]|nr:hypothetical protein GGR56DRAFT_556660 [Xylariaceae sp. FL0804]